MNSSLFVDLLTFSCSLEKESDNKDLQCGHSNHHQDFDQGEIEYPLLSALDRAEISVFSCSEVFLHPADRAQLAADLENRIFQLLGLLVVCASFRRYRCVLYFVLDLGVISGWGHAWFQGKRHTEISKSTILSANVDISLLKQNRYSPVIFAVNT